MLSDRRTEHPERLCLISGFPKVVSVLRNKAVKPLFGKDECGPPSAAGGGSAGHTEDVATHRHVLRAAGTEGQGGD